MSAPTVVVTATISDQNGDAVEGAIVTAELTNTDVDTGYVVPSVHEYTADAGGIVKMNLWPNERGVTESMYRIRAVHPSTGETVLDVYGTIPDQDCNLYSVANLPAYDGKTESQIAADQARQDAVSADQDAATAESSKDAAVNAASSAEADAQTASDKLAAFQGTYYGALSSDPAADPNGDSPTEGDLYSNTTTGNLRRFVGGGWQDVPGTQQDNLTAVSNPGASDDSNSGYEVGSRWLNTSDNGLFICVDSSAGAAVWQEITTLVSSVAGKTGDVTVTKGDVGLGDVTNDPQLKATPVAATDSATDAYTTSSGAGIASGKVGLVDFQSANTTTTPTLDGKTMTTRDGSALWAGAVSGPHELQYASGTDTYLVLEPRKALTALDVMHFGAAADGTTDDTTAFSDALTAASNSVGKVFVPNGTYLIGAITIPLDVILELSPLAVLKPTASFSGDLITLKNNARIEGGLIDCTGQTFTGDIIVPDPTPNVTGNTKRLVRGARNIAMKGDTTGRVLVLKALQDGESVYKDHYENVKCEGFRTFIRMEANNPGAGARGYVNSNIFTACWCNNTVNALTQDTNSDAGDITGNEFINCGIQHNADTSKGLVIGGKYQSFINQQIWDFPATGKNKLEFDSNSEGNYVEGYLGDGVVSNGGTDNTAVNYKTGWMPAQVRKTSFTFNPGSTAAGTAAVTEVALGMGNAASNFVVVQPRTDLNNGLLLTWRLEAAAAGQLLVQLFNATSGAIDPADTTYDVYVFSWGTSDV